MTDHQFTPGPITELPAGPDFRANAFVGAWDRIEAAQKLKLDHKKKLRDPLPEIYWATLAEAAILADLARADEDPGRDAGRHIVDRYAAHRAGAEQLRAAVAEAKARGTVSAPIPTPANGCPACSAGTCTLHGGETPRGTVAREIFDAIGSDQ